MLKNENERIFVESKECEAGIRLLKSLSRELAKQNGSVQRKKEGIILAMMGILERNRQKLIRESRDQLLNLKTKIICENEKQFTKKRTEKSNGIKNNVEEKEKKKEIRKKLSESKLVYAEVYDENNCQERIIIEIENGRNEAGSWEDPIPSNNGVPYDHFERRIFDKYIDYWRNSKLLVPFSTWLGEERIERRSTSIMNFELIEENNNVSCKSIQEAIYRIRRFEQDFQAIPKEIVFPLIEKGILINNSKNMLNNCYGNNRSDYYNVSNRSEFNRAKIKSQDNIEVNMLSSLSSFKVPQSLFFSMVINDHENRIHDKSNKLEEINSEKITSLVSNDNDSPPEKDMIGKKQCNCDFYKLRQKFIEEYNLYNLIGTNSNFEKLDHSLESNLRLWMGAYYLPRNDKRTRGGEDGWFVSEDLQSMGVADGVGEWEDLSGKSARMFSNSIMRNSLQYIKNNRDKKLGNPSVLAKNSLKEGLGNCQKNGVHGASTALVACFDHYSGTIGFANMGDSGALVLRRLQFDTGKLEIVRRVKEMQHEFNCPYQFATLPPENEWPELLEKGYHDIVRLAKIEKKNKEEPNNINFEDSIQLACDDPELSQLLEVPLKEGDMVILGTDGLFDNLFDFEITSISGLSFSPIESKLFYNCLDYTTTPMVIAKSIALSAYYKSLDPYSKTPFANQAKRFYSGGRNSLFDIQSFSGGKEDDISVLVAWVVHKNDFETLTKNSPHYCDISKKL
ncbi:PP2C like protein phosphatase [Cryptosporidium ubiquitum]|uniref:Protein phosphatase n=1 Tax=Cryptosporidium ubiquitum TaxID=857276 RepID=A0A1J4MJD0_9CRYT|nr:PP2C like protein phosphatase [Cryptosporidium ubiquitum]OII73571.1 PP2C like protein phosphatase [Cryptosporidium ubiquitum]